MIMWLVIFGLMFLGTLCGIVYLYTRFQRFAIVNRIAGDRKIIRWLLALIPVLIIVFCFFTDSTNTIVVVLNLMLIWLIGDIISWIIKKSRGNAATAENKSHPYYTGIIVLLFTAAYLCVGWYLGHHVWKTEYQLSTDKDLGQSELKAVLFADSHIGSTFDGEGFAEHMKMIQAEEPDIVFIAGDYVDDDTTREDMIRSCQALGELKTTYGIYYVFGNHDKGYYNGRDFSYADLTAELEKNGVTVLEDEAVQINDSFYVIGRMDKGTENRKSASEITEGLDPDKYKIMLDHQPNDYDEEAASGVDLVLSGHTHGGQLFPINRAGEWIGANDRTYGYEKRDNTEFIVTSGISAWAIDFKTGTRSEYVVICISG